MDALPAYLRGGPGWHTQLPVAVIAPGVDETVDRYAEGVEGAAAEVRTNVKRDLMYRDSRYSPYPCAQHSVAAEVRMCVKRNL